MRTENEAREKIKEKRIPEDEVWDEYHSGLDEGWKAALEWVLEPPAEEPVRADKQNPIIWRCPNCGLVIDNWLETKTAPICSDCNTTCQLDEDVGCPQSDAMGGEEPEKCGAMGCWYHPCELEKAHSGDHCHENVGSTVTWWNDEQAKKWCPKCGLPYERGDWDRHAICTCEPENPPVGPNCDGCSYHVPEDEEDTCHAPKGGAPPSDALCYEDYAEARREAEEE